jgi:hypothetical protein
VGERAAAPALCTVVAALVIALPAYASDFRPTFASEVAVPETRTVLPLLRVVCAEGVRTIDAKGKSTLGCGDGSMEEILASRNRQRRYPWMPYALWEADGVLFGHFLSGTSEDVLIGCSGCEGHPALSGGALLLTKKSGEWTPVWYKPGVIVRHCRRVSVANGRQILFCEETDGGMGHSVHGLYTLDLTNPKFARRSVVLMADAYSSLMIGGVQAQFIDRVSFEEADAGRLVRVYVRHGHIKLRPDDERFGEGPLPKPKLSKYEIDFRLEGEDFKITPETASAGKLFGVH